MIRTFKEIELIAKGISPKKVAILAPEDREFMLAIRESYKCGYIDPVLIGNQKEMEHIAHEVEFDISEFENVFEDDRQKIANLATSKLFDEKVDMVCKGQIPTSYIYSAFIKEESKAKSSKIISVISLWEIPGLKRFVVFTDAGVNISPNYRTKVEIIKNAVFLLHLFGYQRPRICVLSGQREIGGLLDSYQDARLLRKAASNGELGDCEIIEPTSFSEIFLMGGYNHSDRNSNYLITMPDILLVPHLDAGNVLVKMDFILPVTRRSFVLSSKGPAVLPSRADPSDSIIGEITVGVVVADKMRGRLRQNVR